MIFPEVETIQFERYKTDPNNIRRAFVGYSDIDKWNNDPKLVLTENKYAKFDDIPNKDNFALLYQDVNDDELYLRIFLSAINEGSASTSDDEEDDTGIRNFTDFYINIYKPAGINNATKNTYEHNRWLINCCGTSTYPPNILEVFSNNNSNQFDFSNGFTVMAWRELHGTASQAHIPGIITNEKYNDTIQPDPPYRVQDRHYIFYVATTGKSNPSLKYYDRLSTYLYGIEGGDYKNFVKNINDPNKNNINLYSDAYEYTIYVNVELPGYEANIDDYYANMTEIKSVPTNYTKTQDNTIYQLVVNYLDADITDDMETEFEADIIACKNSQHVYIDTVPIYAYTITETGDIAVDKTQTKYKLDRTKWSAKLKINETTIIDLDNSNIQLYANFTDKNILSVGMQTIIDSNDNQMTYLAEQYNLKLGYLKIYSKGFSEEKIAQIFRLESINDYHDFIPDFVKDRVKLRYYKPSQDGFIVFKTVTGDTAQNEITKNKWINGDYGNNLANAKSIVDLTQYGLDDIAVDDFYKNNFIGWTNDADVLVPITSTSEGIGVEQYYAISLIKIYYHNDKSTNSSFIEETFNNGRMDIKSVNNSQFHFVTHTEVGEDGVTRTYNVIGWTTSPASGNHNEFSITTKYHTDNLHLYPIYKRDAYSYTATTPPVYETWYNIQAKYSDQNLINIFNGKSLSDTVEVYLKHNGNNVMQSTLVHPDTGHPTQYEPPEPYESDDGDPSHWSSETANGYSADSFSISSFQKEISPGSTETHNVSESYI